MRHGTYGGLETPRSEAPNKVAPTIEIFQSIAVTGNRYSYTGIVYPQVSVKAEGYFTDTVFKPRAVCLAVIAIPWLCLAS